MFRLVCSKHLKDLMTDQIETGPDSGRLPIVTLDIDPDETPATMTYTFDLQGLYCPENNIDEVVAREVQGRPEEYQKAIEEADCSIWYVVIDADTGYPYSDFIEMSNVHANLFRGREEG